MLDGMFPSQLPQRGPQLIETVQAIHGSPQRVHQLSRLRPHVGLEHGAQAGIEIVRTDARRLPLVRGSFNCILAFDVLEHIEDDRAVMREMLGALAPAGTLWISTPALGYSMFPGFLTPYTNRIFGHVRNGYTPADLHALIPDHQCWQFDYFYWNEPLLRLGFAPLHALNKAAPALAA